VSVISLVVTAIYTGLSQGIQPLISKNHGLGNTDEIKVIQRYSIIALFILSSAIYSFIYFKSPFIASVFN
ncbi:MATE family efflux transporter, partial [Acinetobacter baumannii]|nr:MATE family efflux transporter [Acinetobacter baumannii]